MWLTSFFLCSRPLMPRGNDMNDSFCAVHTHMSVLFLQSSAYSSRLPQLLFRWLAIHPLLCVNESVSVCTLFRLYLLLLRRRCIAYQNRGWDGGYMLREARERELGERGRVEEKWRQNSILWIKLWCVRQGEVGPAMCHPLE